MPALGMNQNTGKILSWLKSKGDSVSVGDPLMEVETDKAVVEVEAQTNGILTEVRHAAGSEVPVGHVVAVIGGGAAAPARLNDKTPAGNPARAEQPRPRKPSESPPTQQEAALIEPSPKERSTAPPATDRLLISPKARKRLRVAEFTSVILRNWPKTLLTTSQISISFRGRSLRPRRLALPQI